MRHFSTKSLPSLMAGQVAGLRGGTPPHRADILVAQPSDRKRLAGEVPRWPVCWPVKRGAKGAGKILVTDYRFAGPGFATRKPVGWGGPHTPAVGGASA